MCVGQSSLRLRGGGGSRDAGSDDDFDFKKMPVTTKAVLVNVRLVRVPHKNGWLRWEALVEYKDGSFVRRAWECAAALRLETKRAAKCLVEQKLRKRRVPIVECVESF